MPAEFVPPLDRGLRMEAMSARLAANWWLIALRGALAILFGILTFILPGAAITTFIILFAAYMLVDGVVAIVSAVRAAERHERWGLLVLEGAIDILVGVAALVWPASAVVAFVVLVAAWAIVSGGVMIAAALRLHLAHGRWFLILAGIVSVLFGVALAAAPVAGAVALALWAGIYAIVFGIALVVLAFRLRGRHVTASPGTPPSMMAGSGI
jgi:uncharacterized membrane protein HdeD (DUF308 family)